MNALNYGSAQVELSERALDVTRVSCKFSRVKSIERQHFRGRAARAVLGGRLGHASATHGLSDDQLIHRAIDAAQVGAPTRLSFPASRFSLTGLNHSLQAVSELELLALAEQIMPGIGHNRPDIAIELELRKVCEEVRLKNSSGGQVETSRAWLEGDAWVERHSGDGVFVVFDRFSSARAGSPQQEFARRMARRLRWARRPVEPKSGAQAAILSPSAFASLLRPLLLQLNGVYAVLPGARGSKRQPGFADRIGQPLFDPRFTLCDDATLPDRPYSAPVDHEGTPGQRTPLIEHGVIRNFYHNLHSAAQSESHSTGNGWRALMEPPRPALTNVVIQPGEAGLPDMLKALGDGLLIDMLMGSDSSDGLRGDFSRTVVLAYQVRRGRVTGFVRGIGVAGNLYHALERIAALGCDGYWSDHVFAPYILMDSVTVTV